VVNAGGRGPRPGTDEVRPAERTAKIAVTVVCYDCGPEEVAARMADRMPDDVRWYTIDPAGEFEIIDARAEQVQP
jgi:hypothetical protein